MECNVNLKPAINRTTEYVSIEYPGLIASEKKMLSTLGGMEHIEEVYNDVSKRLDLKFRPDDPNCKPLCGDRMKCTSLLLRVCKYQRRRQPDDSPNSSEIQDHKYHQSICGVILSTYKFSTLCDYQYMSLKKDERSGEFHSMVPHLQIDETSLKDKEFFTRDVPLFLPPATFGRLDTPTNYEYRKEHVTFRRKPRHRQPMQHKMTSRKSRPHHCISVTYEDQVPTTCIPKGAEVYNTFSAQLRSTKERVDKAFKERPVWSRNALQYTCDCSLSVLKIILPVVSYYVVTGPWSRLWIRLGYDPKENPKAVIYQLMDFRLRQGLHTPYIPVRAKRSSYHYKLPQLVSKTPLNIQKSVSSMGSSDGQASSIDNSTKGQILESVFVYRPGILPAHRQIYYQLCDIHLPEVQDLIKCIASEKICTKDDGWLPTGTITNIRSILHKDIQKTLSEMKRTASEMYKSSESATNQTNSSSKKPFEEDDSDVEEVEEDDKDPNESGESSDTEDDLPISQEEMMDEDLIETDLRDEEYRELDDNLFSDDEEEQVLAAAAFFNEDL